MLSSLSFPINALSLYDPDLDDNEFLLFADDDKEEEDDDEEEDDEEDDEAAGNPPFKDVFAEVVFSEALGEHPGIFGINMSESSLILMIS